MPMIYRSSSDPAEEEDNDCGRRIVLFGRREAAEYGIVTACTYSERHAACFSGDGEEE